MRANITIRFFKEGADGSMKVRGVVSESGFLAVTPYIFPFTMKPVLGKWQITHIPTGKFIIEQTRFRVALAIMRKIDGPRWAGENPAEQYPELKYLVRAVISEYSKQDFPT